MGSYMGGPTDRAGYHAMARTGFPTTSSSNGFGRPQNTERVCSPAWDTRIEVKAALGSGSTYEITSTRILRGAASHPL